MDGLSPVHRTTSCSFHRRSGTKELQQVVISDLCRAMVGFVQRSSGPFDFASPACGVYKPPTDLIKPGFLMARQFHGLVSFVGKIGVHCEGEDKMQSALGARCRSSHWSRNGRSGDRDGILFAWAFGAPLPIHRRYGPHQGSPRS